MLWTDDECYGQVMIAGHIGRVVGSDDVCYEQMISAIDR